MGYKCYFYTGASHTPTNLGGGGCRKFQVSNKTFVVGRGFFWGGGGYKAA